MSNLRAKPAKARKFSVLQIAQLEEQVQAATSAELSGDFEPLADGYLRFSGPDTPGNQALGLGLSRPVSDEEIDHLIDFYRSRGVEPKIEVCPFVDDSLLTKLAKRGFTLSEFDEVFARELDPDEDLALLLPQIENLSIEHVLPDKDNLETFIEIASSGFRPDDQALDHVLFDSYKRMFSHPNCACFLACIDGQPVGGGASLQTKNIVSLFSASVLPNFRRRGIQQALIIHRLLHARELGAEIACIHAHPGIATGRNALRLGFFLAYTRVVLTMHTS